MTKLFGSHVVLRGVDLDVGQHQAVVLIGVSGSGKSTLLRCANLLETVSDGTIHLDGLDITDPRVDAVAVRRRIGMVFQAYNLFPHLSVLDNVMLAPRVVHKMPAAEARDRAMDYWRASAWPTRPATTPTGCQAARPNARRSPGPFAYQPRLLLLDEVTSALDPELVGEVLALVREVKGQGMTLLMATHEMGFAREVADLVCFLDGGVVVESGPPAQVLVDPCEARTRQFLERFIER